MPNRAAILPLIVLCLIMTGCGTGYPYHTLEGSPESRVVVIHLDEKTTEKIPCGSGIGGGLTEMHRMTMAAGEDAVIEQGKAKVTLFSEGGLIFRVRGVEYDGKKIPYHEPLL